MFAGTIVGVALFRRRLLLERKKVTRPSRTTMIAPITIPAIASEGRLELEKGELVVLEEGDVFVLVVGKLLGAVDEVTVMVDEVTVGRSLKWPPTQLYPWLRQRSRSQLYPCFRQR
jgi:hypothetical protein